eukprot:357554-Chlamydomonas_euryale.AAC.11
MNARSAVAVSCCAASRSDAGGGGGSSSLRLLSSLLTEMDGMELATGVLVLAATNRPAAVDAALMRPGRLDVQLYVPPPDAAGRADVLRVHTKGMPLAQDVDLNALAVDTEGFTGRTGGWVDVWTWWVGGCVDMVGCTCRWVSGGRAEGRKPRGARESLRAKELTWRGFRQPLWA